MRSRYVIQILLILALGSLGETAKTNDESKIKVIKDWTEDGRPIRVDCRNLPIVGGGFGGASFKTGQIQTGSALGWPPNSTISQCLNNRFE